MKRSAVVVVGMFLGSVILTACSEPSPDYDRLCVDDVTGQRVDDDECDEDGSGGHRYHYYPHGSSHPAVGSKVTGGTTVKPATGSWGSVPRSGGFGGGGIKGGTTGS